MTSGVKRPASGGEPPTSGGKRPASPLPAPAASAARTDVASAPRRWRVPGLRSIRARMTAAFIAAIGVLLVFVCGALLWYARNTAEHDADALLRAAVERFGGDMRRDNRFTTIAELALLHEDLSANGIAMAVLDKNGRLIWKSQSEIPPFPRSDNAWRVRVVHSGSDTVVFGILWRRTEEALQDQAEDFTGLSMFVLLAAGIGAWVLVGRTLSPIGELSRQASDASADSLRVHLNPPSDDVEVMKLVTTLNDLLGRVSDAAEARGRFYAAASHELRTPLQALVGHLEVALSKERTGPEYRESIEEARRQAGRLMALVRDLLILNRLHAAPPTPLDEPVSLADICDRALDSVSTMADQRGLTIAADLPDTVEVTAAPTHAEMLIRNLVENAVKYALPGTDVRVTIEEGPEPRLEVFNRCEPLPPDVMDRLFEPFYRPDASRTSETGGNGLGLAIGKAVADANGWELTLEQVNGGILATVVFGPTTPPVEGKQTVGE